MSDVARAVAEVRAYLREHPEEARGEDPPATARLSGSLRAEVIGAEGDAVIVTDMPEALGGRGIVPTPGWLFRAALASCDATVFAMRAEELGLSLDEVEVEVASVSDDRGLVGAADGVPAGPLSVTVTIRARGEGLDERTVRDLTDWVEEHSPVGNVVRRSVESTLEIQIL